MKVTDFVPGSPCWTQLATSDPEAAQRFYGGLFGWTAETDPRPEAGGYTTFSLDGSPCAAVAPLMNPSQPVAWQLSFATANADETAAAAQKAGAQVWMGPMDVLEAGRWALLSDPAGAAFGLWQAGAFRGFGVIDEPNAFGWADGSTRDVPGSVRFYTEVFGWEVTPGDYPMFSLAGNMFAGVMDMGDFFPPEVPAHWTPFFVSADVDATVARARELGADVMHEPEDVQMENGPRIAVLRDPQGAAFGVFKPAGTS
ncbi:MAG TPA: VOC family protein [Actinospica sp.]|nr:VOC family protein [Actinospica sp.]